MCYPFNKHLLHSLNSVPGITECPLGLGTAHLVHLGLGCLLEGVEHHVQVLLELSPDGQGDVPEHREDLGLHRPVHVLILGEKKISKKSPGSVWEEGKEKREWPQGAPGFFFVGCFGMFLQWKGCKRSEEGEAGGGKRHGDVPGMWEREGGKGREGRSSEGRKEFGRTEFRIRKEFKKKGGKEGGRNLEGRKKFGRNSGRNSRIQRGIQKGIQKGREGGRARVWER